MVKSIESYISETTKSYDPAIKAINNQISGLDTSKSSDFANLERSYASQQAELDRQKNLAARDASIAAGATGNAFSGASNIARRNYYQKAYVPAVNQLNSNRASAEENINKNYNERKNSLEAQLANLYSQANTYAMQRYDDALKQDEAIRQYNESLALQKAKQDEAIRQYNENLALQKAQQEEAIRQYNLNLELERQKLAESKRAAQAAQASNDSWMQYFNQTGQNQQQPLGTAIAARTVMSGSIPVRQVLLSNGQWVNESDYKNYAKNAASSIVNKVLGRR